MPLQVYSIKNIIRRIICQRTKLTSIFSYLVPALYDIIEREILSVSSLLLKKKVTYSIHVKLLSSSYLIIILLIEILFHESRFKTIRIRSEKHCLA